MPNTPLPIATGFYVSDSLPISAQECVGWYPNVVQAPALAQETLFGVPGISQITAGLGLREINRGSDTLNEQPYFVNGNTLYRLDRTVVGVGETFSVTALGTIDGEGRVSMAVNETQVCILVPGGKGYIFTTGPDTLTEITDPDFRANGNPLYVVSVDGFFVFTTDEKKFIISALNDGLAYNALDFGTAESDPDRVVAPAVFNNQLFIGGSVTMEAFQNVGGADFPFQRTGLFLPKGISAPLSAVEANNTFMWIGRGKRESSAIYALQGNTPVKVSTTAIDSILQDLSDSDLEQVFAWTYAQKGAFFVGFALPDTTLVFDSISERWHERKSQIIDTLGNIRTKRNRVNSVVAAYGRVLVGDSQDGRIGEMSPDYLTEYDQPLVRVVATQPFQNNMQPFSVASLELTMEAGVGNEDSPDPVVQLEISRDGGKTWSDPKIRRIGKIGEYGRRTIWRRLGRMPRFAVFRFTLTAPVKPVIIQLMADIVSG